MQIKDNSFLVTGGSSGLGFATVQALVAQGGHVIAADLADFPAQLITPGGPGSVTAVKMDVTDEAAVRAGLAAAKTELRGVINCAGMAHLDKMIRKKGPHSLENFERVLNINLTGTFNVCRLAAEAMWQLPETPDGERGVLINTASCAAYEGQSGQVAYAAAKGAVAAMTLPMARDLGDYGVRVMTIAPAMFDTGMTESISENMRETVSAGMAFPRRFGRPEEYAELALHIIQNPMLNGETIRLDGGIRMGKTLRG